jgi:AcrR family transcriptional regulator
MPQATPVPARDRILHAAHDLFYRDGIRATGIDRVIAESAVTKVTFYRHFASKNELVVAFLELRHERWMRWFVEALGRHASKAAAPVQAVPRAIKEWLSSPDYRGCAFINSVGELGESIPEVAEIARVHKEEMSTAIERLLPPSRQRAIDARAIALAVDGAICHAQFDEPGLAVAALERVVSLMAQA